jgi:membrane protease subunit HflK
MAWNEPGNGDKDPWGNRGNNNDGPPDLDDVLRNMQNKIGGLFGGKSGNSNGNQGSFGIGLIALIILVVWLVSGLYTVDESERGVVLRFGEYNRITTPGPNWHMPFPIEKVEVVNIKKSRTERIGFRPSGSGKSTVASESLMLTQDENIIQLETEVQYRVADPAAFLFNVEDPSQNLRQMTESAVREVVGQTRMDDVIKFGRGEMAAKAKELLQKLLDDYGTGLFVTSFNFPDIQAPSQVRDAFADVIKAGADKERMKNEAEAYSNDIIPRARGGAFSIVQEAEAYKEQVIAKASGEASRFEQVLKEYAKAPEITAERLYIDAMEKVYTNTQKVLVDVEKGSNSMLYLPIDKLREKNPFISGEK